MSLLSTTSARLKTATHGTSPLKRLLALVMAVIATAVTMVMMAATWPRTVVNLLPPARRPHPRDAR